MHHFVQSTPSNGDFPAETGALPSAPQSLLDLTMDLPHLGNPFPSPTVVKSCRLSSFSSTTPSASVMTESNCQDWEGAPPVHSLVGSPPACLTFWPNHRQSLSLIYLFVLFFKIIKTSPSLKLLLKVFPFLWKTRRPLPLWTETNPHKRNIPP